MNALLICAAIGAYALWSLWRDAERTANRTEAYRELRLPRPPVPLSETPAMRRVAEWRP